MALISDASYILDSLRRHHLQNCRNDHPSVRLIKLDEEKHSNHHIRFSPYIFAQQHAPGRSETEQARSGRDSPELAIDKEIADFEGLHQRQTDREGHGFNSRLEDYANAPDFSPRYAKSSTATIKASDGLGTPFSVQHLDATPRTSEEYPRDPNVKLNYSKTIGRPSKGGLGRFMGLRVDDTRPLPSLVNQSSGRDQDTSGSTASATPTQARNELQARLQSGLSRRSTSSTLESFSNSPRPMTAFSPYVPNEGQPNDRTPTGRTLSGLPMPPSGLRQPALRRVQRPRADSAPMVVISSPNGSGVRRHSPEVTPKNVATERAESTRGSFGHGHRKTSTTSNKSHYRKSTAFSPSAIQSVLGEVDDAIESEEDNIPRPGEDPREHAKRDLYGSILAQTLMSQTSRRPGFGLERNLSLYMSQDSSALAEESEGSEMGGMDTDGYDVGDTSTDAPESQQSNQGIGNFDMGLTKADESLLGGLDLETRMSMTTSSYSSGKRDQVHPLPGPTTQIAFEKQPVRPPFPAASSTSERAGKMSGGLSLLFHPPQINKEGAAPSAKSGSNPFSTYASVPPPHNSSLPSLVFSIYYPFSEEPDKSIQVTVRKEVTVEEVIGWALFKYYESERKPALHDGHDKGPNKDVNPAIWRTTAGWALRIVEDDGEVDEDFPALDRESSVAKFAFGAFAVVEANPTQIQQAAARLPPQSLAAAAPDSSASSRPSVSRSSSRVSSVNGRSPSAFSTSLLGDIPSNPANAFGSASASGPSGMGGVMVHLKIRIIRTKDIQHITSITVPSEMYFADIIEVLIKKKRLLPSEPSEWALLLGDLSMVLPLDRTVESLMGNVDLALVTKSWADNRGLSTGGRNGERRGGDPSTSIFKRGSELNKPRYGANMDYESTYRKYKVQRKMPIGKHERILAIDGDYIHIMPTDTRAFFDSMKTSSFHATSITACKQYAKSPASFRIVVWRDGAEKRYEFEAESARESAEIIAAVKALMKLYPAERKPAAAASTSHHHGRLRRRKEKTTN